MTDARAPTSHFRSEEITACFEPAVVEALWLPLALLVNVAFTAPASAQTANRPNILVIFGDDIGYMNVSSFGGDIMGVRTPTSTESARKACAWPPTMRSRAARPAAPRS